MLNSLADVPNVERTLVQRMTELGFLFRWAAAHGWMRAPRPVGQQDMGGALCESKSAPCSHSSDATAAVAGTQNCNWGRLFVWVRLTCAPVMRLYDAQEGAALRAAVPRGPGRGAPGPVLCPPA